MGCAGESSAGYRALGRGGTAANPDETIHLKLEKVAGGRCRYNRWTINGNSWPETNPLFTGDTHLHRHSFVVANIVGLITYRRFVAGSRGQGFRHACRSAVREPL